MLACVVNSRLQLSFPPLFVTVQLSPPVTPLESAFTHFVSITLLESAFTKNTGVCTLPPETNTKNNHESQNR
jgi:hypothetical protein